MNFFRKAIPPAAPSDPIEWAETSGLLVDGHSFDSARSPQLIEPIRNATVCPETRVETFIGPVQSGKSTAGEIVVAFWAMFFRGFIQVNYENDGRARERWNDRFRPLLNSLPGLKLVGEILECIANLVNGHIRCQGVFDANALNADTVPLQLNDEVHLWPKGHLSMAEDRQTRIWNAKRMNISNASKVGDQLHIDYQSGTMQEWENQCPHCGIWAVMHFRYSDDKKELGGLRWDADTRLADGRPDYNALAKTLRYQFPCGHEIKDTPSERRSLKGRYGVPQNPGAHVSHKSHRSDAVSYHEIPWITLVKEWHSACMAMKSGDQEPMFRFVTRRECQFFDNTSIPYSGQTIYNHGLKKNRTGLPGAAYRAATADWQFGMKSKGELQHYWLYIEDIMPGCDSQIVFEGKVDSDAELLAELDAHQVERINVWIDCSKNTKAILQLCWKNGMNAVNLQLSRIGSFLWPDGTRKFYSTGQPIHLQLNVPPVYERIRVRNPKTHEFEDAPHPLEPTVVNLNKAGMLANHFFIRNFQANTLAANPKATPADYIRVEIPSDVSEDFKRQNESWQYLPNHRPKNPEDGVQGFKQRSRVDHLLMCRAFMDFLKNWLLHPQQDLSLLSARLADLGLKEKTE